MENIHFEIHGASLMKAHEELSIEVEKRLTDKLKFIKGLYDSELTESRFKKIKIEENDLIMMTNYAILANEIREVYSKGMEFYKSEARMWHNAYLASVKENVKFTKTAIEACQDLKIS